MRHRSYLDQRQSDNHERWLVSYSDFITLLFAFFVVMYAISSVNEVNYRTLGESLSAAFRNVPRETGMAIAPPSPAPPPQPQQATGGEKTERHLRQERMQKMARAVMQALAPLLDDEKVRVTQSRVGIAVEINAGVLFAPGSAVLEQRAEKALRAVAPLIKDADYPIQVEGHTDDVAIRTPVFPSNWELSTARASSVVRALVDAGIEPSRLSALGFGEHRPLVPNDTPEGRARNRRVVIRLLSVEADPVTEIPIKVPLEDGAGNASSGGAPAKGGQRPVPEQKAAAAGHQANISEE
jgi:chemotaxis protein MotB